MAEFSGQLPAPGNGLESSSGVGPSQQTLPASLELPQQSHPASHPYGAPAVSYTPQYLPPQQAAQQEQLRQFWQNQMLEIHQVGTDPAEFKNHQLPLARIKKIMKSDEDVRMISAEAPVLFARACEMFILELTLRSWNHSEENKRRTLQRNDIAAAITRTDIFDFLVDIVPREERGEEQVATPRMPSGAPMAGSTASMPPYWQQPAQMGPGPPSGEQPVMPRPPHLQMDPAMMQFYLQQQAQQQQQQQQPQPASQQSQSHPQPQQSAYSHPYGTGQPQAEPAEGGPEQGQHNIALKTE